MGCWQKFREPLQNGRHGVDVEDEAREQKGWQKARKKPCLCCHKLPLHVYGDEKALAQGAEHEDGGDEKEGQIGAPEGYVKDQDGKDCAKDEGEHAKRKVGDELSQYELQAGYGGTRKFTLLAEGLYQKRSCTPICGSTMFFSCKRPLMCPWITLCA